MEGRPLAERIRAQVAEDVRELGAIGLATVQVGEDEASTIYLRLKHKAASEVEIASVDRKLAHAISEEELLSEVAALNADEAIDGILVQLPLPDHLDEARVIAAVDPIKDVDGFHPFNAGQLYLGRPTHVPATPLGVMALLAEYKIPLDGARAVVVGRSTIVGKPVAHLLLQAHSTVIICHSQTWRARRSTRTSSSLPRVCPRSSRRTWSSPARRSWTWASTARRAASSAMSTPTPRRVPRSSRLCRAGWGR